MGLPAGAELERCAISDSKGVDMGEKGKKDTARRENKKKAKLTLKEKRKRKKEKKK